VKYKKLFVVAMMIMVLLFTAEWKTAFASSSIQTLLTNWFEGEKQESIRSLEMEITKQKEAQMAILKKEIATTLANANQELANFTAHEAEKSKEELKAYTNALLQTMEFDMEGQQEQFLLEVERIMEEAYEKLEQARAESIENTE
jgi:phosphotransacetylase